MLQTAASMQRYLLFFLVMHMNLRYGYIVVGDGLILSCLRMTGFFLFLLRCRISVIHMYLRHRQILAFHLVVIFLLQFVILLLFPK